MTGAQHSSHQTTWLVAQLRRLQLNPSPGMVADTTACDVRCCAVLLRPCSQVLSAGGVDGYKVDAAYIWSVGSWDVQGIHTASAKWNTAVQQGDWPVANGYADAAVTAAIKAHNAKAAQRR